MITIIIFLDEQNIANQYRNFAAFYIFFTLEQFEEIGLKFFNE